MTAPTPAAARPALVFASRGGAPPKVALAGLTIGVKPRECLGMLGHNGAGKTTAISMLCGLFAPTGGDARVLGRSIRTAMAAIHGVMGVCPQHDVLWRDLSAAEHVAFYARLRRVPARRSSVAPRARRRRAHRVGGTRRRAASRAA